MRKKSMVKQVRQPKKVKKKTDIKENGGKVLINLGQLIFGTLFLGSVLRGEVPQYIMIIVGLFGAMVFIVCGLILSAKEQKGKEK